MQDTTSFDPALKNSYGKGRKVKKSRDCDDEMAESEHAFKGKKAAPFQKAADSPVKRAMRAALSSKKRGR